MPGHPSPGVSGLTPIRCRAPSSRPGGVREQTTREHRNKVHDLLGRGRGNSASRRSPRSGSPADRRRIDEEHAELRAGRPPVQSGDPEDGSFGSPAEPPPLTVRTRALRPEAVPDGRALDDNAPVRSNGAARRGT
ncbi:hypothetical protein F8144_33415 [Streptomyces triticiradicis]|uniref:Uncharacterized protein n=1 Tax=Streptomyces triticiradicis TaxID=2651189 RepID=A0A7J5D6U9_9ACTN|nr:hypothetical protein F8144_33415 [Streptomyces triticiradicis]